MLSPPSVTRTFLLAVSFPSSRAPSPLPAVVLPHAIDRNCNRGKLDRPGGARVYTIVVVERKRKDEERHEETRVARRQGVSAFQLDSMANRSPTKGNGRFEGVVCPVSIAPSGSLNISFRIPRNV